MAKKVILKDQNNIELMPITRGELVLDSSGVIAFHSNDFLATDSQPGLMSLKDKSKLDSIIIDEALNPESTNPVQNKVITQVITSIKDSYLKSAVVEFQQLTITDQDDKEILFYNDKVQQINTTTDSNYRLLFSNSADDEDEIEKTRKSSNLLFNPQTGVLNSPNFVGNLDGVYISALTSYIKATSEEVISTTDSLITALGKLEYKADLGFEVYNWYKSITEDDADDVINKWQEIVDFVDSVKEGTDILQEFVTIGSIQTITGNKTFNNLQINTLKALTDYNSSTYSSGTNGQVLKSNGTSVYWGNDNNDKVTNTLNTTTKAYITGTTNNTTNTDSQIFDTGVYLGEDSGYLHAFCFVGDLQGNALTASTLKEGSNINGTLFTGESDITTNFWGVARNISITDGTTTSDTVSVNGSQNVSLKLPSTIHAAFVGDLNGTASVATKIGTSDKGSSTKPIYLEDGVPTECNAFAGGTSITLNDSSKASTTASFYAPEEPGTLNHVLISRGAGEAPTWTNINNLVTGVTVNSSTSGTYDLVGHSGDTLYAKSGVYFNAGTACLFAAHFYETSDIKFKTDIKSITSSDNMPILREFTWKENGTKSYGFIAQELEELGYEELVNTNDEGTKTVNYSAALSLIVGKLQNKINELTKEIENLKNKN